MNYSEVQYDMVRTGIGLYGYGNDNKYDKSKCKIIGKTYVTLKIIQYVK